MANINVTFEVDTSQLFDTLQKLNGDSSMLGLRLVTCLLTGKASAFDAIGMAAYGVTLKED